MDRYVADALQKERLKGYIRRNCPRSYCKSLDLFRRSRSA